MCTYGCLYFFGCYFLVSYSICFFFFKQKTAYEMRISDWSSDVCSSDLAAAIQLFGAYKGTDREEGLRWVLPWLTRKKIAVRANNVISDKIKVNDLRGNPIEMAAQVVWRVTDTAQALFDVDDYKEFVRSEEHTSELQSLMRISYAVFCLTK